MNHWTMSESQFIMHSEIHWLHILTSRREIPSFKAPLFHCVPIKGTLKQTHLDSNDTETQWSSALPTASPLQSLLQELWSQVTTKATSPRGRNHIAHNLTTQEPSILRLIFNTAHFPCAVFAVPTLHEPFSQMKVLLLQLTGKAPLWGRQLIIFWFKINTCWCNDRHLIDTCETKREFNTQSELSGLWQPSSEEM